jgi:hypothetical protein
MNALRTLGRSERGIYLTELMVSVSMLAVMVLGMTTVLIVQARQMARDKVLTDMYYYADMILDETATSFGTAAEVERNANAGGTVRQDLEFNFVGTTNMGRKMESRFTREGERKVIIRHNGQRPAFIDKFPPPELDPDRHRKLKYRVYVKDFRVRSYQDREFVNPRIGNILSEVVLTLELEDKASDYKVERTFRRIFTTPNKHITENRLLQSGQGS